MTAIPTPSALSLLFLQVDRSLPGLLLRFGAQVSVVLAMLSRSTGHVRCISISVSLSSPTVVVYCSVSTTPHLRICIFLADFLLKASMFETLTDNIGLEFILWVREVVFLGRKATLMLETMSVSEGGWHNALSKKRCLSSIFRRLFILVRIVTLVSGLIHTFALLEYWAPPGYGGFGKRAKQRGNLFLPITIRPSFSRLFVVSHSCHHCIVLPLERANSQALPSRSSPFRAQSIHL